MAFTIGGIAVSDTIGGIAVSDTIGGIAVSDHRRHRRFISSAVSAFINTGGVAVRKH
jgi:hypothetical protein